MSIALGLASNIILSVVMLFIVYSKDSIDPGLAGACLVYAMLLPENIFYSVHATSNLENAMVSVERVQSMTNLQTESDRVRPQDEILKISQWPKNGTIEFREFSTRYRADTELVLYSITATIKSNEKIGIMGRTGSGKSSLINALLRIIERVNGKIIIDGIDIADIGLDLLRQSICVIPQDPALFQGKLRENIDPLNHYTDKEILNIGDLIQFKLTIDLLDMEVKEGASNFSIGEKQLICITRALLRKCKIITLDEATASIDFKTDIIIQKVIKDVFKDCTVITIAHRINTILHSDRIMIFDQGKLVAFDHPNKLKKNNIHFKNLVN